MFPVQRNSDTPSEHTRVRADISRKGIWYGTVARTATASPGQPMWLMPCVQLQYVPSPPGHWLGDRSNLHKKRQFQ